MRFLINMKKILFIHIPKTGGLSLNSQLIDYFSKEYSARFGDNKSKEKFKDMSIKELEQYNYITGHFPLNKFRAKGIMYPALAIIRNPIDRLLSMYNYLNQSDHPDHKKLKFEKIDNFIDYIAKNEDYDNIQCRYIGRDREHSASISVMKNDVIYVVPLSYFDDMSETLGKLLSTSIQNIQINKSEKSTKFKEDRLAIESDLQTYWEEDMKLYEFVQENYFQFKDDFLQKIEAT